MKIALLCIAVILSGCTYVRINAGDGGGDIYVDRSKGLRSAIAEDSSKADTSGLNEAPEVQLKVADKIPVGPQSLPELTENPIDAIGGNL